MNPAEYMQFGNILRGQYTAQQQAILNQQRQQQLNDTLANDALKRHLMQQQVTAGGQGYLALGNMLPGQFTQPPPVASNVAPAPAPGQSSQPKPPQNVDVPGASNIAQFTGNGGFANLTTPQQAQVAVDKGFITPRDGLSILADMNKRGTLKQQFNKGTYPASAPPPWTSGTPAASAPSPSGAAPAPMQAPMQAATSAPAASQQAAAPTLPPGLDRGTIGRSLALAQSNLPVNQLARFVQNYKRMYPNASAGDVYFAVQQVNPTLVDQANGAAKIAGMTIDSLMKSLTTFAQITNAQTRQAELPSQIAANEAKANASNALAALYGGPGGSGLSSPQFQQNLQTFQTYYPGKQPSRYMIGLMENTPPDQFKANALSGRLQSADQKALGSSLTQTQNQLTQLQQSYSAVEQQAALVQGLQSKVPGLTNSSWFNGKVLGAETKLASDPNAQAYVHALVELRNEFSQIVARGGRGVTDQARKLSQEALNPNMSVAALAKLVPLMQQESRIIIGSRQKELGSLKQQLAAPSSSAPSQQFQQGAIYTDANGNKARYDNGQWVPVK